MGIHLGIDTSNYKTSVAAVSDSGDVLFSRSEYLEVPSGERGLRQSEVFFRQSNILPEFIAEMFSAIGNNSIDSIGVSTRPRRVEGSYMPCFLAGLNAAREIGAALNIPVHEFSHQEGHAAAVMETCPYKVSDKVIFFHLSGGTTEFLLCEKTSDGYTMTKAGGTRDISIGQLFDRIGVALGHPFPAGRYLDETAEKNDTDTSVIPRIKTTDGYFNLSGIETSLLRYIESERDRQNIDRTVSGLFLRISELLYDNSIYLADKYYTDTVVMAGGVASSSTVRSHILRLVTDNAVKHAESRKHETIFGEPEYSGDNAVGTALLARRVSKR